MARGAPRLGVITTFWGYGGGLVAKVQALVKVFNALGLPPLIQLHSAPGAPFEELAQELGRLGTTYHIEYCLHQSLWLPREDFYLNLASPQASVRKATLDALKKSVDFARRIGARRLSFHPGCAGDFVPPNQEFHLPGLANPTPYKTAYAYVAEGVIELLEYAQGEVVLSVENLSYRPEKRYLFSLPQDFSHLPPGAGILLDTGHAYYSANRLGSRTYLRRLLERVAGRVAEIHASDNDGSEDEHDLMGRGGVPFLDILSRLAARQEVPPIIIEANGQRYGYTEADLAGCLQRVASLVAGAGL